MAVDGGFDFPVLNAVAVVFLGDQMEGRVGQVEVEEDGFCAVGALGLVVGEEGLVGVGLVVVGFGEDVEGDLREGSVVFEGLIPGAGGEEAEGVGSGFEILELYGLGGVVNALVGPIVELQVEVGTELEGFVLIDRQIFDLKGERDIVVRENFSDFGAENFDLGLVLIEDAP